MKKFKTIIIITLIILGGWWATEQILVTQAEKEQKAAEKQRDLQIETILSERQLKDLSGDDDPFEDRDSIKVLLVGIDSRAGDTNGHCDAIQLIEINKKYSKINITAVPRGTYAPLPGTGHLPTDYYVSNSCGVVGIEYGIEQIERILGQKADYLVFVGFSEAVGIFRELGLPTTETLQWLRNRQSFAIGEPQRAKNHSTFIKQMLLKYSKDNSSTFDATWQYVIYKMLKTDLSFPAVREVIKVVDEMNLEKENWRINLYMRPAFEVADIPFDEENLTEQLHKLIDPIAHLLPEADYSDETKEETQKRLQDIVSSSLADPEFANWAWDNHFWLQIEDEETRQDLHFELIKQRVINAGTLEEKEAIISEYILKMENRDQKKWEDKGRDLLKQLID
jgi:hypothetical protein